LERAKLIDSRDQDDKMISMRVIDSMHSQEKIHSLITKENAKKSAV